MRGEVKDTAEMSSSVIKRMMMPSIALGHPEEQVSGG